MSVTLNNNSFVNNLKELIRFCRGHFVGHPIKDFPRHLILKSAVFVQIVFTFATTLFLMIRRKPQSQSPQQSSFTSLFPPYDPAYDPRGVYDRALWSPSPTNTRSYHCPSWRRADCQFRFSEKQNLFQETLFFQYFWREGKSNGLFILCIIIILLTPAYLHDIIGSRLLFLNTLFG